jgi:hypothetical protein
MLEIHLPFVVGGRRAADVLLPDRVHVPRAVEVAEVRREVGTRGDLVAEPRLG